MPGIFEEIDYFSEFLLGLVDTGYVGERDARALFHHDFGLGLADRRQTRHPLLLGDTADDEVPNCEEHQAGHHPRQQLLRPTTRIFASERNLETGEPYGHVRLDAIRRQYALTICRRRLEVPLQFPVGYDHALDTPGREGLFELGIGHDLHQLRLAPQGADCDEDDHRADQVQNIPQQLLAAT